MCLLNRNSVLLNMGLEEAVTVRDMPPIKPARDTMS
jgi:hypothetical protein